MYKKILLTIFLISPLFFLLVGYPVVKRIQEQHTLLATSQRCFVVGNASQFFSCLINHQKISEVELMGQTVRDLNDLQPLMGYLFIVFLVSQVILLPLLF